MRQELSASYTWAFRWGIPGLLTLTTLATLWFFADMGSDKDPETGKVMIGILLAAAQILLARTFDRAKCAWLEDDKLFVYDFNQTAEIELRNIAQVKVMPFFWPHRVRVVFTKPTVFGDAIVFFPRVSLAAQHPTVTELRLVLTRD